MSGLEKLKLAHDELEAVRLCDVEGMTQTAAGKVMGVSRGTVQRLVCSARKKIVESILLGRALMIELEE